MRRILLFRFAVLFSLVGGVALGKGREPLVRSVYLREDPKDEAARVAVSGQVATVLRLQRPCDPAGTKLLGWEGRFEPVVCAGKSVVLVPLQNLEPDERFMLLVTLEDGKELPFTVMGAGKREGPRADQQVNVFIDPVAPDALRTQLAEAHARERLLWARTERHLREDTADHALARLVMTNEVRQTPFTELKKRIVKAEGVEMVVRVFGGRGKAAVLFTVTNRDPSEPWSLMEARLVTKRRGDRRPPFLFGEAKPFALRMDREEIGPGESANVAVVVDASAFKTERGPVDLVLELYRQDGWRLTYVIMDRHLIRR